MGKVFKRKKRVNLDKVIPETYIPEFDGCYVLLHVPKFNELQQIRKDLRKLNKKIEKQESEFKKIDNKIKKESNEDKILVLEADKQKIEDELESLTEKILEINDKILLSNFAGGMIKNDKNELVELVKEDLNEFDIEVRSALAKHATGGFQNAS